MEVAVFYLYCITFTISKTITSYKYTISKVQDNISYREFYKVDTTLQGCAVKCIKYKQCKGFNFYLSSCRLYSGTKGYSNSEHSLSDDDQLYIREAGTELGGRTAENLSVSSASLTTMPQNTGDLTKRTTESKSFGSSCSANIECDYEHGQCLTGECACVIGFSYDFSNSICVTSCSTYGDSFSTYESASVTGCNVAEIFAFSPKHCSKICREVFSFVCINCEFKLGQCHLCNQTWYSLKEGDRDVGERSAGWSFSYRHCLKQG